MNFATAQLNMVESQIHPNRVTDAGIIVILEQVAGERFIPEQFKGIAYVDQSTPIAKDRYLMEPMILADLLQSEASGPSDIIPDIACGTGNAVAMLARLAENVVGLESDEALVAQGNQVLTDLGVDNAVVVLRDLHEGYSKQSPYNLIIIIERAVSKFPEAITDQLVDGGRLVAVMTDESGLGRETVVQKVGQLFSNRILFEANVKALPEFSSVPVFVF